MMILSVLALLVARGFWNLFSLQKISFLTLFSFLVQISISIIPILTHIILAEITKNFFGLGATQTLEVGVLGFWHIVHEVMQDTSYSGQN